MQRVVANCGFGLGSEVLQAGKKQLTKPLQRQPEQHSNAAVLDTLGLAEVFNDLSVEQFQRWYETKKPQPVAYPDMAKALALWLKNECQEPVESLASRLWSDI